MFYTCQHFKIWELIDKETFERWGGSAWMFLNPAALQMIDGLWEFATAYGGKKTSIVINDWHWGGHLQQRGLRTPSCTIGGKLSQHRFGNAFDCFVEGFTAEEMRQAILENYDTYRLQWINCIEAGVDWLHLDCRNIPDRIRIVRP